MNNKNLMLICAMTLLLGALPVAAQSSLSESGPSAPAKTEIMPEKADKILPSSRSTRKRKAQRRNFGLKKSMAKSTGDMIGKNLEKAVFDAEKALAMDLDNEGINEALKGAARQLEQYAAANNLLLPEGQSAELLVLYAVKATYEEIPGDGGEPSGRPTYIDLDLVSRFSQANGGEPEINLVYISIADNPEQEFIPGEGGEPSYSPSGLFLGELRKALEYATNDPVAWINNKINSLK